MLSLNWKPISLFCGKQRGLSDSRVHSGYENSVMNLLVVVVFIKTIASGKHGQMNSILM